MVLQGGAGTACHLYSSTIERETTMAPSYRLTTFALAGGYLGLAVISSIYVQNPDGYGFSVAQYQRWALLGIIAGIFSGLGAEIAMRIAQRRHSQFSIREYLLVIAFVAIAIVTCGALAEWARTADQGISKKKTRGEYQFEQQLIREQRRASTGRSN
jgi:H+/Cl- antiporter ClcA